MDVILFIRILAGKMCDACIPPNFLLKAVRNESENTYKAYACQLDLCARRRQKKAMCFLAIA